LRRLALSVTLCAALPPDPSAIMGAAPVYLTATDAARLLGCEPAQVLVWATWGRRVGNETVVLEMTHVGTSCRFTTDAVAAFKAACRGDQKTAESA
jgi:hypothetical protein